MLGTWMGWRTFFCGVDDAWASDLGWAINDVGQLETQFDISVLGTSEHHMPETIHDGALFYSDVEIGHLTGTDRAIVEGPDAEITLSKGSDTTNLCFQAIKRISGGDVKGAETWPSKGHVARYLGNLDDSQSVARRVNHPDSAGTSAIHPSFCVYFHTVGDPRLCR